MPELPEVETVKEILKKQIVGETIKSIDVYYDKILENTTTEKIKNELINETIVTLNRYGKYLMIVFTKHTLICHLRMEGKFFLKDIYAPIEKHEHIVFNFESGKCLRYHDTRKFGKMVLLNTTDLSEIMKYKSLVKLGPEANGDIITKEYLYNECQKSHMPIKTVLLDQDVIAGLGNIYVDEVCFISKLNPKELANHITLEDAKHIVDACHVTLKKAIEAGGTTIRSYTSSLGVTGRFQLQLLVHTKEKEPCPICGSIIKKTRVGGRGTYYCPKCQALKQTIIGVTGMIASGKSQVINYLSKSGFDIIDCDQIVKKLYTEPKVLSLIKNTFGEEYVTQDALNKEALGKLIFNDKTAREQLDDLIHPLVKEHVKAQLKKCKTDIIFIDVPLLFEANFTDLCHYTVVVYLNNQENIKRLINRDHIDTDLAIKKINSQMDIMYKCAFSNFIIDNSKDLCYTYKQVEEIISLIKKN